MLAGSAVVVALAWLLGLFVPYPVLAASNGQVATRVTPRLVDLLAAFATGAVGSVALARSDISDTLPGVAIAISLVPPLAVVGLTLESGAPHEALGAFLLFGTNVVAILVSGTIVMAFYRVLQFASVPGTPGPRPGGRRPGHRRSVGGRGHPVVDQLGAGRPDQLPGGRGHRSGRPLGQRRRMVRWSV